MPSDLRRVLLAEDDDTNRTMLRVYLEKRGFAVTAAQNGLELLELLDGLVQANTPPQIVLLDVMMPVLTGIETLRRLRPVHPDLPIIMLTALGGSDDVVSALQLGADDYVTKPYDFTVLIARMEARLRRNEQPRTPVEVRGSAGDEPMPGMIIDERYELLEPIGSGSFGVVYRARHTQLETNVAVKILRTRTGGGTELMSPIDSQGRPRDGSSTKDAIEDFRKEGVRACRVQHENAVRVFDYGVLPSGVAYLVMELLHGRSLEDELVQDGPLPFRRAAEVMLAVTECLAAAHLQHIVHRDVKPANIFLHRPPGDGEIVKVVDFGVAKLLDQGERQTSDTIAGSPAYMAPERLRGRSYDGRADMYSVGICLYELVTGRLPFESDNTDVMAIALMQLREIPKPPSLLNASLPPAFDRLVLDLLEKDPVRRPDAGQAMLRLGALADHPRERTEP